MLPMPEMCLKKSQNKEKCRKMKRIVSILLILVLLLGTVSCKQNKIEVQVIWSDLGNEYLATVADAIDRAMYIKNIRYTHKDSQGSAETQLTQVDEALAAGAGVVVVNAVNADTSVSVIEKAKAKDAYVIFLCCDVDDAAVKAYEKCVYIDVDPVSVVTALGDHILADMLGDTFSKKGVVDSEAYEAFDRNGDGVITYLPIGVSDEMLGCIEYVNETLEGNDLPMLALHEVTGLSEDLHEIFTLYNDDNKKTPELLLVGDDAMIESVLLSLRKDKLNFNNTMLKTHFIPLYTVGIAANAGNLIPDKKQEERDAYSVMNAIDSGFVSGAALEDDDGIALALCTVLTNVFRGQDLFEDIQAEYLVGNKIFVPYTYYG